MVLKYKYNIELNIFNIDKYLFEYYESNKNIIK